MVCSCPDLSYDMSLVNRYMANPSKEHWKVVQWIFRYLCGNSKACLKFGRTRKGHVGYDDSNFYADWIREGPLHVMFLLLVIVL
jgi:hypothetical protein